MFLEKYMSFWIWSSLRMYKYIIVNGLEKVNNRSISLISNLINAESSDPSAASLSQNANNANLTAAPRHDAF